MIWELWYGFRVGLRVGLRVIVRIGSDTWNPTKGRKLWHFYSLYERYGLGLGLELGLGLVLGSGLGLGLGLGVAPNAGLHCFLPKGESCALQESRAHRIKAKLLSF